ARASVFKLGSDLALVTAYGDGGEARRGYFSLDVFNVQTVDVDSQGRAVVAVNEDDSENTLIRFTADGAVDLDQPFRFDSDAGASEENELVRAAAQPDGKIMLGGFFARSVIDKDAGLARLNGDGSPDGAFGGDSAPGQQAYSF